MFVFQAKLMTISRVLHKNRTESVYSLQWFSKTRTTLTFPRSIFWNQVTRWIVCLLVMLYLRDYFLELESHLDSRHYSNAISRKAELEVQISQWYHLPVENLLSEMKPTFNFSLPGFFISPLSRATNRWPSFSSREWSQEGLTFITN